MSEEKEILEEELEVEETEEVVEEDFEVEEEKEEENEDLKNQFIRLQADFSNYKKRVEKEKQSIYSYANEQLILKCLPVIDNFERALESATTEEKEEGFYKGMELIHNQLIDALKASGLSEIESDGAEFDPNLHHAVMQEASEDHEEDTVIQVLQKGYKLNEKVIRPSMVKVSK